MKRYYNRERTGSTNYDEGSNQSQQGKNDSTTKDTITWKIKYTPEWLRGRTMKGNRAGKTGIGNKRAI